MRTIGTVVRGVRAPIIREGDNIAEVAAASVMEAWKEAGIEPARAAVIAALRAQPFQPEALDSALQRQHATIADQIALGQQILRDRLVAMTDDQRAAFADRLEQSQKRKRDDRHGDRPGKP